MAEYSVKKEQLINWKILKQSEGQLLATNAYALLTSEYFSFSKTQCAVFKGTDRAVFLDKREFTGPIYTQIRRSCRFCIEKYSTWSNN
ncbi:MAG: hypothetical protein ACLVBP_09225 [Ruminococcus sp.]